jgi:dCTP deaminase
MILSDLEIEAYCRAGMVEPFDVKLVGPASLDVRLGGHLMVELQNSPEFQVVNIADTCKEHPYLLEPGAFVLGETLEILCIPVDLAAQFVLKSSRAREGLEHLLAGFADPGFNNSVLTLELQNARQFHPVPVWHGMKIGQLVFYRMSTPPDASYAIKGHYNGCRTVTASRGHM